MASAVSNPKGSAFRELAAQLAMQIVDQLTNEFEQEVSQMSQETVRLRSELAKAADFMRTCIDRERQLHEMLEELTGQQQLNTQPLESPNKSLAMLGTRAASCRALPPQRVQSSTITYGAPPASTSGTCTTMRQHAVAQASSNYSVVAQRLLEAIAEMEQEVNRISVILQTPGPAIVRTEGQQVTSLLGSVHRTPVRCVSEVHSYPAAEGPKIRLQPAVAPVRSISATPTMPVPLVMRVVPPEVAVSSVHTPVRCVVPAMAHC